MNPPNRNIFAAKTFVDELARCGLEAVCIAPGSRSTPLVIAFAEHPAITAYSHIDERSAAFFALGLAQATNKPVALVCSSGTATANFHPAIIEARYANIPLLVLTADRQPELRASGANQTIDQVKMFGDHVLWFYDVALPEAVPPGVAVRNLRTLADRAYQLASGIEKGPVHLNFPFRKPLEPTPAPEDRTDLEPHPFDAPRPMTVFSRGTLIPAPEQTAALTEIITSSPRGIIICGPRTPGRDFPPALAALATTTGYPVFADAISGMRFNNTIGIEVISQYDIFLSGDVPFADPDLVIHFGAMPASAALEGYLNRITTTRRILISATGQWTDPYHRLSDVVQCDPAQLCWMLRGKVAAPVVDRAWADQLHALERTCRETIPALLEAELFDGSVVRAVTDLLTDGMNLVVASSLPVRHLEQYTVGSRQGVRVYANRGASGIDGTVSTAFGVAAANPAVRTVLLTGDLAFYHDLNGLLAAKRAPVNNLTIVLVNNDGGGIFNRLPIAQFDPPFTDLFLTPHGLDFEPAVRMYGLDYARVESLADLRNQVRQSLKSDHAGVIEVRTDSKRDHARREAINQAVQAQLRTIFAANHPASS